MDTISNQRMKEIEEEMNRFENEIAHADQPEPASTAMNFPRSQFNASNNNFNLQSPPRPPPHLINPIYNPMFPQMGAQPFRSMFVPPQLRNRPVLPPQRPPFASIRTESTPSSKSSSISAPKVVYSAPPVKNTTNGEKKETDGRSAWKRMGDDDGGVIKVAKMELPSKAVSASQSKPTTKTTTTTASTTTPLKPKTSVPKAPSSKDIKSGKDNKKKKFVRMAAGNAWEDTTLNEWDPDDFRIFCGDLGNEVTDDVLIRVFNKYPSFQKARVIRDKRTNKTKGYGFASFKDPNDFMTAIKEVNGRYVGNRPIKLRKSCWQDRQMESVKKRERDKKKLGYK